MAETHLSDVEFSLHQVYIFSFSFLLSPLFLVVNVETPICPCIPRSFEAGPRTSIWFQPRTSVAVHFVQRNRGESNVKKFQSKKEKKNVSGVLCLVGIWLCLHLLELCVCVVDKPFFCATTKTFQRRFSQVLCNRGEGYFARRNIVAFPAELRTAQV